MGVNKPDWVYLLTEDDGKIDMEDGNGLVDSKGNGSILLEQQDIGCDVSPLLASIPLVFFLGTVERLAEVI